MKNKLEFHVITAGVCALLFVVLMALVAVVDVQPIGPMDTTIGLASINASVRDAIGYHAPVYWVSELLGLIALLTPVYFGIMGLKQLQQHKDLRKVELDLYVLAAAYVLMAMFYIFFELCVLNYRPILVDGEIEASFPSSHTMLSITLLGTAASQFGMRMGNTKQGKNAVILCYAVMVAIVLTRFLSGVHWLTDIIGGLLLGTMLVQLYAAGIDWLQGQTFVHFEDTPAAHEVKPMSIKAKKPVTPAYTEDTLESDWIDDMQDMPEMKKSRFKLPKRYTPKH